MVIMRSWKEIVGALFLPIVFICSALRPKSDRPEQWSLAKVNSTTIQVNIIARSLELNVVKRAGGHAAASGVM
jgi:hypothetical protein